MLWCYILQAFVDILLKRCYFLYFIWVYIVKEEMQSGELISHHSFFLKTGHEANTVNRYNKFKVLNDIIQWFTLGKPLLSLFVKTNVTYEVTCFSKVVLLQLSCCIFFLCLEKLYIVSSQLPSQIGWGKKNEKAPLHPIILYNTASAYCTSEDELPCFQY